MYRGSWTGPRDSTGEDHRDLTLKGSMAGGCLTNHAEEKGYRQRAIRWAQMAGFGRGCSSTRGGGGRKNWAGKRLSGEGRLVTRLLVIEVGGKH